VAAYQQSGMSADAFEHHCGIKYPTFASWVAKARQPGGRCAAGEEEGQCFILAEIGSNGPDLPLKLELPGGIIIHVTSSQQLGLLADLLKALK
jgi:hypothetical protein